MHGTVRDGLAESIKSWERLSRLKSGEEDVLSLKRLMVISRASEILGRLCLHFAAGPFTWLVGAVSLAFHLALESQFMHSIMHGAYVGLPGAKRFTPQSFETLAVPLQCKTWGQAHGIHHRLPSLVGRDPDTLHPLYRVHRQTPWRPLHRFNTFLAPLFVFEGCAFNYDRLLKKTGLRPPDDRGEIRKFTLFIIYQYILFPSLAGEHWWKVLAGNIVAVMIRNLVVSALQMASSVGHEVSVLHSLAKPPMTKEEICRFQIETSKNYVSQKTWRPFLGGLDRHIEHHLFPHLPPTRLHDFSAPLQDLCDRHGVRYFEYPSLFSSLKDSLSYLHSLSKGT